MLRACTRLSPAANRLTPRRRVPLNTGARARDAAMIADRRGPLGRSFCSDVSRGPRYYRGPNALGIGSVRLSRHRFGSRRTGRQTCCNFDTLTTAGCGFAYRHQDNCQHAAGQTMNREAARRRSLDVSNTAVIAAPNSSLEINVAHNGRSVTKAGLSAGSTTMKLTSQTTASEPSPQSPASTGFRCAAKGRHKSRQKTNARRTDRSRCITTPANGAMASVPAPGSTVAVTWRATSTAPPEACDPTSPTHTISAMPPARPEPSTRLGVPDLL